MHSDPSHAKAPQAMPEKPIPSIVEIDGTKYHVDLGSGIDISIAHSSGVHGVRCFGAPPPRLKPFEVKIDDKVVFTGAVEDGGSCNCFELTISPHLSGTHTEGVPHLTRDVEPIGKLIEGQFFLALLVTIDLQKTSGDRLLPDGDLCVTRAALEKALGSAAPPEALIIRTTPNSIDKMSRNYTGTNPPYIHYEAANFLREIGVVHLVVDLPSLDREEGELLSHRTFFQFPVDERTMTRVPGLDHIPDEPRWSTTATELAYIPDSVSDGVYLLNLNPVVIPGDASPTRPIIYAAIKE